MMECRVIGDAWVTDLCIDQANHYISDTGLVNKNTDCAVEEAGNFADPKPIDMLFGALRSKSGVPVQLILTANPGGVGQQWIKHRYIDPAPRGMQPLVRKLSNGAEHRYIYIPSRIQDNRILLANDPTYINRLHLVGSPELVRAWLEGDWNVIAGAFFPEFSAVRHIMAPRTLPDHWARFRSFDWGSARPFACHWWAVSDGSIPDIARGCLVCYREWYGMKPNEPNVGLRMTAEQVAEGIRDRERDDPKPASGMMVGVADPAIFAEDGGPSIAARMTQAARVVFRPADNKRVPQRGAMGGWDQLRSRLVGDADGKPMVVFFSTSIHAIRTLPTLQHDANRAEDVDCWVAGTMVSTPGGPRAIETIEPCDLVDTPLGPRPVLRSYLSGTAETVRATLSDGRVLEGTPQHKIMISGVGLVALSDLKCQMIPRERIIWQSALSTTVSSIRGMRDGFTTIRTALTSAKALAQASIVKCGLMPVAKFLPVGMSIIETTTTTTTNCPTSSVFHPEITRGSTSKSAWRAILVNDSRSGVGRLPDARRSALMRARWSSARLNGNSRVLIVKLLLSRDTLINSFAPTLARSLRRTLFAKCVGLLSGGKHTAHDRSGPVRITAVGRSVERMPVYNLTVADAHLFYANGILSSNTESEDHCGDSVRYSVMSRPYVREAVHQRPRDSWDAAFNRDDNEVRDWRVA